MTLAYPSDWIARAHDALARLAEKPWTLFLVLLAVNALARPYAGITHDSRLYSGQVLNRVEDGVYSDDLFFRYGSQDEYSIFSTLAAPLVQVLGLPIAFFVIYLISKSLMIWGMLRLVQTLVPNRTASTLALLYCMIVTVRYGGQHILNVQETFVTPRLLAIALVLIGLDLMLRQRPIVSGVILLFAVAVHPLMAFGGLLIWVGFCTWQYLGMKAVLGLTIGVGALGTGVLSYEPLGLRCFGAMDEVWRQCVRNSSSFNFPSEWVDEDWCFVAVQLAILGITIWQVGRVDRDKSRFLIVLAIVTVAAIAGSMLAERFPYALLVQGQAYRALWIVAFLHLAFAFWLFVEWSQHPSPYAQLAACVLLVYLCWCNALAVELIFPLCMFPCVALALRGLEWQPRDSAWLTHSINLSLIIGGIGWTVYKTCLLTSGIHWLVHKHADLRDVVEIYLTNLGPIVFIVTLAWALVRFGTKLGPRTAWLAGATCLVVQTLVFAIPETDVYARHCTHYRSDLRQVRALIEAERDPSAPLPTVYCNLGCLEYVWLDLHAHSYFDWWQAGGSIFRRDLAVEGQRRAGVVGPFELERFRKFDYELTKGDKEALERLFLTPYDNRPLVESDLARLCQEPGLDYVVLEQRFEGLFAVQKGRLYLYRCQQVRTALGLPAPRTAMASSHDPVNHAPIAPIATSEP